MSGPDDREFHKDLTVKKVYFVGTLAPPLFYFSLLPSKGRTRESSNFLEARVRAMRPSCRSVSGGDRSAACAVTREGEKWVIYSPLKT